MAQRTLTEDEWNAEGERLFGTDRRQWRFICPSCKHVATVKDWEDIGAPFEAVAFSCVGRWIKGPVGKIGGNMQPCDYAGGGLFKLNPVHVIRNEAGETTRVFEFAPLAGVAQ